MDLLVVVVVLVVADLATGCSPEPVAFLEKDKCTEMNISLLRQQLIGGIRTILKKTQCKLGTAVLS